MRAAGSRRRGRICQEEKGEVGRGKEASPGDNEVGLGGTGDCRGLPAGLPFNGERGGAGEPCAGGREANPLVLGLPRAEVPTCQILCARPPLQREQTLGPAGHPTECWDPGPPPVLPLLLLLPHGPACSGLPRTAPGPAVPSSAPGRGKRRK